MRTSPTYLRAAALAVWGGALALGAQQPAGTIPPTRATALDGHAVVLPSASGTRATVLILGFGRHSSDATTAWEKPVRTQLAHPPEIGFYDIAMIAEVPGFMRGLVTRMIRNKVPPVLQPNFLPLTAGEDAWKKAAGYDSNYPEAAYVLVVDSAGHVRWSTHEPFSPGQFSALRSAVGGLLSQ